MERMVLGKPLAMNNKKVFILGVGIVIIISIVYGVLGIVGGAIHFQDYNTTDDFGGRGVYYRGNQTSDEPGINNNLEDFFWYAPFAGSISFSIFSVYFFFRICLASHL